MRKKNVIAPQGTEPAGSAPDELDRFTGESSRNLMERIVLSYVDASRFVSNFVCATCTSDFFIAGEEGSFVRDRYYMKCRKCGNDVHEGQYVSRTKLNKIKINEYIGRHELKEAPKMTTEQALEDLGF